MEPIIEFRHVRKAYGSTVVIPDLNLAINKGEFVTMVGTSGSGKTTTLKMVNGLHMPTSGQLLIRGEDIRGRDLIQLRRHIGYAIQGSVLFPHLTVAENICYVPRLLGQKDKGRLQALADRWMDTMGLDRNLENRMPAELSGGQQQRVGIARALAAGPEILFMDEPFGAVDALTRKQLQDELKRLHRERGLTILFVTHDMEEALKLGTKVLVMDKGVIQQYGAPAELLLHPAGEFVRQLVETQRRTCFLPEEKLADCVYSGGASGKIEGNA